MSAGRPAVLVVDDESSILDSLRILLKNSGFDVSVALGGKAALEQLEKAMPDIVLTDIRMPQISGMEVLDAVRERDVQTPVIFMTAQAELRTAIEAVNRGAFYYVLKPFSNDDLVAIVHQLAYPRRRHADAELERLNLFGYPYLHLISPAPLVLIVNDTIPRNSRHLLAIYMTNRSICGSFCRTLIFFCKFLLCSWTNTTGRSSPLCSRTAAPATCNSPPG